MSDVSLRHAALAALSCVALVAASANAVGEPVGKASAIRTSAYQQPPQATVGELHLNDSVIRNAVLHTLTPLGTALIDANPADHPS